MNNLFLRNLENLISKKRLESYNNDIDEHNKNLDLISKLTPTMAMIEISIRNIVDFYLAQLEGNEWIANSNDTKIIEEKNKIHSRFHGNHITHEQYLSNFSFGTVVHLARIYNLQNYIFDDLSSLDFKEFSNSNRNFYFYNNNKNKFTNYEKADIIFSLLLTIRNRFYHWENILKTRTGNKNKIYPRITSKLHETKIGIMPDCLEKFLNDIFMEISTSKRE